MDLFTILVDDANHGFFGILTIRLVIFQTMKIFGLRFPPLTWKIPRFPFGSSKYVNFCDDFAVCMIFKCVFWPLDFPPLFLLDKRMFWSLKRFRLFFLIGFACIPSPDAVGVGIFNPFAPELVFVMPVSCSAKYCLDDAAPSFAHCV